MLAAAIMVGALVVKADGVLAFPLHTAPAFLALYVVIAAVAVRRPRAVTAPRWRPIAES
jgi:hypothetical protein